MNNHSKTTGRLESATGRMMTSLCSLGLISFGMILYKIVLIRLYAVLLSYHYVFAILSLAVFGLGMGGLLLKKLDEVLPTRTACCITNRSKDKEIKLFRIFPSVLSSL